MHASRLAFATVVFASTTALAQSESSSPPEASSSVPASSAAPPPEERLAPVRVTAAGDAPVLDRERTPIALDDQRRADEETRPAPRRRPPPRVIGRNAITWQPLSLIFASWDFEYERTLIRYLSAYVAGSIVFGHNVPYGGPGDLWVYGGAGDLGLRVFPFGRAPSGFFVQTYFGLTSFYDDWGGRRSGLGWRIGLMPGYSLVVARYLVFSFGTGLEYMAFTEGAYESSHPSFTLRTALGVVF